MRLYESSKHQAPKRLARLALADARFSLGAGASALELRAMSVDAAMVEYYRQRAPYYERVYHKPERQEDLRELREMVVATFAGKHVLDVACGTGYWTEIIGDAA